ncbi:Rieske 2Fe-2S domain-containing protein [Rhodoferax sediminis]|uniref:Ring-hydroxylating oxygenase subunit alpha n=1 Tax=Rhodoferax sediminis TaxID=2509614 RepID=A0A515DDN4_9BURK|nr:Rieske 2Fe-2S domain-containing protein [Rhodoferax sediminis]QDL38480.1 ring-hydroxylating oxygenase subunit alpha [Rhodoferax sediminis]
MSTASPNTSSSAKTQPIRFNGYNKRDVPAHDAELTSSNAGTPMGEYMRQFWQPVCLSVELTDVPKAIRIMGEDLVAFRDKSGDVGVLHRHCSHRGASLEFGVIAEHGIRCCYHGWHYAVDGELLDAPCEADATRLKQTVCHGAYPAFERDGLVFAYMGPPDKKPPFPEYDTYTLPKGTKMVPFSNIYPCNWLQVFENIMDHMHTAVLHNKMVVEGVDAATADGVSLEGFGDMPVMQWEATRSGNGIVFIAGRRLPDDKVWVRITEMVFPNYLQIGSLVPTAATERHGTSGCTRWNVPVDDTHMIIFGFRHFNSEVDPAGIGCEADCGVDKIDFLVGQTGNRSYDEGQRAPGDWEALVSQRPIAIHALEHPGSSDIGVYMCRKLLREAVRGKTPPDALYERLTAAGSSLPLYAQDSVLHVPELPSAEDRKLILSLGKRVFEIMRSADDLPAEQRDAHVRQQLDELDGGASARSVMRREMRGATA